LTWTLDAANTGTLTNIGLVSGAVWTDLDGDGFPELVLACEWGPVRVFKNATGKLKDATKDLGLDKFTGLWTGVTAADVDGDGRMDLIAGNWGLNSRYRASEAMPLKIFWGEFAEPGRVDVVETEYDEATGALEPLRRLDALSRIIPSLREKFPTHRAFSEATLEQVFSKNALTNELSVTTLASSIFLNRGDHFERIELPLEAQLAPVFGLVVADFDGDGDQDIFLSENFFENEPEVARCDAGRGVLLENDGTGHFKAVAAIRSGIASYGEGRGAAASDFDGDGRMDLAIGQNGASTQLYHNEQATPGLKVRLRGGPGNSDAVGAVLRPKAAGQSGPAQEIHAGAGYWSQDGAVRLVGPLGKVDGLEVRWPGGKVTAVSIPNGAKEAVLDSCGDAEIK
jgi:hypothetical protein